MDAEIFYWHDKNPTISIYPQEVSLGIIDKPTVFQFEEDGIYWFYAKKAGRVFSSQVKVLDQNTEKITISLESISTSDARRDVASPLKGKTLFAPWELEDYVRSQNGNPYNIYIAKYYLFFGHQLGLCGDLAYAQSIHETGWFKFGGDVVPEQNNYAGIGTIGGGVKGHYFNTPEEGVLGQFQHLWAYAVPSGDPPLVQKYSMETRRWEDIVDPRYHLVNRGSAPLLSDLSGRWAVDTSYAQKIISLYDRMLTFLGY